MSDNKTQSDCVFCKIIAGEIPCLRVYEDTNVFCFLSISPVNPGHTLLVPKEHAAQIYDISDESLRAIGLHLKKISKLVKKATSSDGVNIIMNNEKAAGQAIFHAHIHIIPRFFGDGFIHWEDNKKYKKGEGEAIIEKMKLAIE